MFRRCLSILLLNLTAQGAAIPEGGKNVLSVDWQATAKAPSNKSLCRSERVDFGDHGKGWRVEVFDDKAGPFQLQLSSVLEGEIKTGDRMLVVFDARCVPGSSTDGKGRAQVVVELKNPPDYVKLGQDAVDITQEWQTIFVPFPANADSKPGITHASLMVGGKKQTLEVSNMRLLNYGSAFDLTKLPRPYIGYPGREVDAPWRKEALARIEKIRTTDFAVEVVDANGKPQPGAKVRISLKRQSFGFGTAVKAKFLAGKDEISAKYQSMVEENFSAIVLENDLKPFAWTSGASNKGKEFRQDWTRGALAWAKERGMKTRGHYLCWGPWDDWSEKLKDQPTAIRQKIMSHVDEIIRGAAGLVDEWDAVNHPVGWESPRRTVDQFIGPELYADVFKAARARTGVPLWINEDQVFREGRQQDEFYDCIKGLIAQGVRPDGIGNQAHFHSSYLPGVPEMLRISDRFASLVPNLELTEFDVITNGDEELQADWLRDTLIMAYSHPAYSAVMLWVFWEGAGWKPETALWRKDWSEKPNAKVWRELVCKLWRTQAIGETDQSGLFGAHGHRGLYEVTVEIAGKKTVMPFNTEHGVGMIRVVVPMQ
jgi:GH35 family endo-1,4-beta-xylanase